MKDLKNSFWQFVKFNIVGILNTVVDFLVYTALTELLHLVYIPAKIISYTCGVVNSYIFNTSWTFKKERNRDKKEMFLFLLVCGAFTALPIIYSIICAFKPLSELFIYPPRFFVTNPTFDNFR